MTTVLDWSGRNSAPLATVGPLAPCRHCRRLALLRHPVTKEPCHKACAERAIDNTSDTTAQEVSR
jgi:hypothetical protein